MRLLLPMAAFVIWMPVGAQAPALPTITLKPDCTTEQATRDAACRGPLRLLTSDASGTPTYPPALRAAGVEGFVVLGLELTADGRVASASVRTNAASNNAFVEPTTKAIGRWRFDLPESRGEVTPLRLSVRVSFEIGPYCDASRTRSTMTTYEWYDLSRNPMLRVITCPMRVIPRDQLRPRPGGP